MENLQFLPVFLAGFVFIIAGWILYKFPPTKINSFYGYRTWSSQKSQAHWDFAQVYSGKLMLKLGCWMVISSALLLFIPIKNELLINMLTMANLLGSVVVLIFLTERKLKHIVGKGE
jgi:uncharacterized membrane protein